MTSRSARAAWSTSARQKQRGSSLASVPIMPESRHRPGPPRNLWSVTPSSAQAAASSPIRYSPSRFSFSAARCASDGGMTSPSSPDGTRVAFLRTQGGGDPVTCLWVLDVGSGRERLVADPRTMGGDEEKLPPQERARRERVREQASGIVAYATDADVTVAVFS